MRCPGCDLEVPEGDFYGKEKCYKCVLKQKTLPIIQKKKADVHQKCKVCKRRLPKNRWAYCSDECSWVSVDSYQKNYWSRKVKNPQIYSSL